MDRYQISVILTGDRDDIDAYADMLYDIPCVDVKVAVEYVGVEEWDE